MELEERLIQIETKITYLENDLHELNQIVIEQDRLIRRLTSDADELRKQLHAAGEAVPQEKPPHY